MRSPVRFVIAVVLALVEVNAGSSECRQLITPINLDQKIEKLAHFDSHTSLVVNTGIVIDPKIIQATLSVLQDRHTHHQISFETFNADLDNDRISDYGDLSNYPHQLGPVGNLQHSIGIQGKADDSFPFLSVNPSNGFFNSGRTSADFPAGLTRDVVKFIKGLARAYLNAKGPGFKLSWGKAMIRATSNKLGHRITRGHFGDNETGLHKHGYQVENTIEFVWALHGPGAIGMVDGQLVKTESGQALLFGSEVEHGSPDSEDARLIGVGNITLEPL